MAKTKNKNNQQHPVEELPLVDVDNVEGYSTEEFENGGGEDGSEK